MKRTSSKTNGTVYEKAYQVVYCLIALMALLPSAKAARADSAEKTASEIGVGGGYRPFEHMWMGLRDLPNRDNAILLGAGSAMMIAGLVAFDKPIQNFFNGPNKMGTWGKAGDEFLGTGFAGIIVAAGSLSYGLLSRNSYHVEAGEAHFEALLASTALTAALKQSVRRERPNSNNPLSFPSGHTSTTFTSAGSLMGMYGPVAGIPALALATYTATARLAANAHHLSDVAFGATLGYILGFTYTRHHQRAGSGLGQTIDIMPIYESSRSFGVSAQWRY